MDYTPGFMVFSGWTNKITLTIEKPITALFFSLAMVRYARLIICYQKYCPPFITLTVLCGAVNMMLRICNIVY